MRRLLLAAVALAVFGGGVIAQQLQYLNLTGNETFVVSLGGPGGTGVYATVNQVRNTIGYSPVTSGSVIQSAPSNGVGVLNAIGAISTAWQVKFPNPAFDGELFGVANSTGSSFTSLVSVSALSTPQVQINNIAYNSQTLAANTTVWWIFNFKSLTWYRIQ